MSEELQQFNNLDAQNGSSSGSESDPQIDELSQKEIKQVQNDNRAAGRHSHKHAGGKRLISSPSKCPYCLKKMGGEACQHGPNICYKAKMQLNAQKSDMQTQTAEFPDIDEMSGLFYSKFLEQNFPYIVGDFMGNSRVPALGASANQGSACLSGNQAANGGYANLRNNSSTSKFEEGRNRPYS